MSKKMPDTHCYYIISGMSTKKIDIFVLFFLFTCGRYSDNVILFFVLPPPPRHSFKSILYMTRLFTLNKMCSKGLLLITEVPVGGDLVIVHYAGFTPKHNFESTFGKSNYQRVIYDLYLIPAICHQTQRLVCKITFCIYNADAVRAEY